MLPDIIQRYKKVFFIIVFVIIILVLGYLIYSTFFQPYFAPGPGQPGQVGTSTEPGGFPQAGPGEEGKEGEAGEGRLPGQEPTGDTGEPSQEEKETEKTPEEEPQQETTALNEGNSQAMTLSGDGDGVQYYDKDSGKFYRVNKDGEAEPLTDQVFHNVDNINWSPTKDRAILEYPDGSNILYDFSQDKQVTLPKHWKEFDFSPDGEKIVTKSIGLDTDNRWLAIANADGSQVEAIESLGENEDSVYSSWSPNNQIVGMYTEGAGFDRQEVYFIGKHDENFKSTTVHGRGFQPKWSPQGDRLMYSVYSSDNDFKPQLWMVNSQGESIGTGRKSLGVNTWADKCTFADNSEMYCAVPKNLDKGSGIFPEMAEQTNDQLYRINTQTGTKELISNLRGEDYNISSLEVSQDRKNLFFVDSKSEKVHKLDLE